MTARLAIAASVVALLAGCGGGDEEEDDRPQFACRYDQHSFTLCSDGTHFSSDNTACTMVRSPEACTARTASATTCSTACCTDTTYRNVTVARGSC